jgi:phosphatidate cytidylyltransferase
MLGVLWIGGLGGFAFDIIKSEYYGWLVAALVVTVAVMDIGQYFVGRRIGKRALAPVVSPKKTVEGLVGGVLVALLVGVGFSYFGPFDLGSGLLIGAVVAVVAPIGDLAVYVIKRAICVKYMSSILPGHGGILDRIDAMIFTIPAMWIAYSWLGLLA